MRQITLIILLTLTLSACCSISAKNLPKKEYEILPIVLGTPPASDDQTLRDDRETLAIVNFFFQRELNISFHYDKIYYSDEYLPIEQGDLWEFLFVNNLDVGKINTGQKIVIFIQYARECVNLLGFGQLAGIQEDQSRIFFYLNGDQTADAYVLIHEMIHIFGGEHTKVKSIMYPYQSDVEDWSMADETKDQILETLGESHCCSSQNDPN
jgi:hypothetical protein